MHISKGFCRDYGLIKPSQLPMFMAVVKGVKPLMDDWVSIRKYKEVLKICKKYNLIVEPGQMFIKPTEEQLKTAVGSETLTTTKFLGIPFNPNAKEGEVHIFISKSKEQIKEAHKFGWYPLIIRNRVIKKAVIDNLRFGKILGYPDCCIKFFAFHNREGLCQPYETLKNTKGELSYYCNNIPMDFNLFLIHHHPCSFNCKKTIKLAKEVENAIEEEPEYAGKIKEFLKKPLLVFGEKNSFVFDGQIKNNKLHFKKYYFLGNEQNDKFSDKLNRADCIEVKNESINLYQQGELIEEYKKQAEHDGFILQFT